MKLLILALCFAACAAAPQPAHWKPKATTLCAARNCYCRQTYWNVPVDCATCSCTVSGHAARMQGTPPRASRDVPSPGLR